MKKNIKKIFYFLEKLRIIHMLFNKIYKLHSNYLEDLNLSKGNLFHSLKLELNDFKVLNGPFKDLIYYSSESLAFENFNKIIGTYELELHPILYHLFMKKYDIIIDIGSAEGYYVVGFTTKWPEAQIFAYDNNPQVIFKLKEMLKKNNILDRVIIKEWCDENELLSLPQSKKILLLSDCEGYEINLFTDKVIKHLKNCDFIIEAHDGYERNISKTLIKRFRKDFKITIIKQKKRRIKDFPLNTNASDFQKISAMYEGKGYWLRWLFIESKGNVENVEL